jgi:hypothetical protein
VKTAVKRAAARTTTAAACAALLLTGCGSDEDAAPAVEGPTVIDMPVSGNRLMVGGEPDEVGGERFEGKPTFLYGCLGAESGSAEGMKQHLVVWPEGTTVAGGEDDSLKIGDEVLEPGSSFVGRGISVSKQPFPEGFPDIPIQCLAATQDTIWWVQEIDEITE